MAFEELPLVSAGIRRARQVLESKQLNPNAHVLIILYRDLKSGFP